MTLLLSVIAGFIYLFNPSAMTLKFYNFSLGVTICTWVLFNVLFSKEAKTSQLITNIGLMAIANNIGSYVAPIVTGYLIKSEMIDGKMVYQFSSMHHVMFALVMGVSALLVSFLLNESEYEAIERPTIKKTFRYISDTKLWLLSIVGTIVTFMKYSTLKFSFETIVIEMGGRPSAVGNIDANYDLLHAIAGIIAGSFLIKRIGKVKTMILGIALMALSFLASYLSKDLNIFLFVNLFAGFGMGLTYITAMGMAIENVPYEYKNTRMGLFQSLYMLGIFYAPKICIYLDQFFDRRSIYLLNVGLSLIAIILLTGFTRMISGRRKNEQNELNNAD